MPIDPDVMPFDLLPQWAQDRMNRLVLDNGYWRKVAEANHQEILDTKAELHQTRKELAAGRVQLRRIKLGLA